MAMAVFWVAQGKDPGYFLPVIIFAVIAFVSFIIGFLGTGRAVAKYSFSLIAALVVKPVYQSDCYFILT